MALNLTTIRLLARSHAREPFQGPILTLGRQGILATIKQCAEAIRSQGVELCPLRSDIPAGPNVPAYQNHLQRFFTNDRCVFTMLCGEEPLTLDISSYEQADFVHDLNQPIPDDLRGRFGVILDGGTLEHVFNLPQALFNLKAMLKVGGRIIHVSPMSNWSEHGFFQFSPTFFNDFYAVNGFDRAESLILETGPAELEGMYRGRSAAWRWTPRRPSAPIISPNLLGLYFEARQREVVADCVPQQGAASDSAGSSQLGGTVGGAGLLNRLRTGLLAVAPSSGSLIRAGKRILRRDWSSRPWGLEFVGRF